MNATMEKTRREDASHILVMEDDLNVAKGLKMIWVRLLWSKLNQLIIKVFSIINIGSTPLPDKIIQQTMDI